MIDIKILRENPEMVKENIKRKFQDHKLVLVDEVLELDRKNRESKLNGDNLIFKSVKLTGYSIIKISSSSSTKLTCPSADIIANFFSCSISKYFIKITSIKI